MACFTCTPIDLVQRQTVNFAEGLFKSLTVPCLNILGAILLAYTAYLMLDALLKGSANMAAILKVIFAACIIRWGINFAIFQEWFLTPFETTILELTKKIIAYACSKGGIPRPANGAVGLVEAFEKVFLSVLTIAEQVKNGSWYLKIQAWVISLIAALPFAISLAYLIFTVIGYYLCLATLAGLAPIWLLLWFLPATRGMCYAALRLLVANSLELILVCVILVFALVCVKTSLLSIADANFDEGKVSFIGGHALVLLVLGFVSLFAQTQASTMAGAIAGAPTTNKSLTSGLTGAALVAVATLKGKPSVGRGDGVADKGPGKLRTGAQILGAGAGYLFGGGQEALVNSEVAGSIGRSINYGVSQAFNKIADFSKYH